MCQTSLSVKCTERRTEREVYENNRSVRQCSEKDRQASDGMLVCTRKRLSSGDAMAVAVSQYDQLEHYGDEDHLPLTALSMYRDLIDEMAKT